MVKIAAVCALAIATAGCTPTLDSSEVRMRAGEVQPNVVASRTPPVRIPNYAIRAKARRIAPDAVERVVVRIGVGKSHSSNDPATIAAIVAALRSSDRLSSVPVEPGTADDERGSIEVLLTGGEVVIFRFHPDDLDTRWNSAVAQALTRIAPRIEMTDEEDY